MQSICRSVRHLFLVFIAILTLCVVTVGLAACSGLGGEPPIVSTLPPPTDLPPERGFPAAAPDLAVGREIFLARCTRCHGPAGQGNGPLIGTGEGQIAEPPLDFTDPATTSDQSPLNWFDTITNGRVDRLMPPWREALSEDERWAVSLYTYTMSYKQEDLARGETVATSTGLDLDSLPNQVEAVALTNNELVMRVAPESMDLSRYSGDDVRALASFLRTRLVEGSEIIGDFSSQPLPTPEAESALATTEEAIALVMGTVTGKVSNGTADGFVPEDLIATLNIVDEQSINDPRDTTVGPDGTFKFSDVPVQTDRSYIVTVSYQERTFFSEFVQGDPDTSDLSLPVTIYELTQDPSVVKITGLVSQVIPDAQSVRIVEVISMTNTSDRAFSTDVKIDDTRFASVSIPVPADAVVLSVDSQDPRFVVSPSPRTVTDTEPVLPGQDHIVHVVYSVPYDGERPFDRSYGYAIEGQGRVLVPSGTLALDSAQLPALGQRTLGNASYDAYGGDLALGATSAVNFTLRGSMTSLAQTSDTAISGDQLLPIALIVLGAAVVLLAFVLYFRGRGTSTGGVTSRKAGSGIVIDGLIQEIAELEQQFKAGELDKGTYDKRRARLKRHLAELIDRE